MEKGKVHVAKNSEVWLIEMKGPHHNPIKTGCGILMSFNNIRPTFRGVTCDNCQRTKRAKRRVNA